MKLNIREIFNFSHRTSGKISVMCNSIGFIICRGWSQPDLKSEKSSKFTKRMTCAVSPVKGQHLTCGTRSFHNVSYIHVATNEVDIDVYA